jgi:hypothetical protein
VKEVPDSPQREKILWLRVIHQAILDSEGRGEIDLQLQDLAKWWLTNTTRAFLTVCSRAGMPTVQAHLLQEQQREKYAASLTRDDYFREFERLIDTEDDE